MGAFNASAPTDHLTSSITVANGGEVLVLDDLDLTGCVYAKLFVNASTDLSATESLEIRIKAKKAIGAYPAENPCGVLSIGPGGAKQVQITLQAGIYQVTAINNDPNYTAYVDQVSDVKFTYA